MSLDRKALVVDDDAGVRLLMKHILLRNQFEVEMARDGAEALEKLRDNKYAVIILDLMMPRINGAGVVHYLQEHAPEKLSSVIVVTAFGPTALQEVCPPIGRFIEKPFDVAHFMREVTECYWMSSADYDSPSVA